MNCRSVQDGSTQSVNWWLSQAAEVEGLEPTVEDVHPGPVDHYHPPDRVAGENVICMGKPEFGVDLLQRRSESSLPLPQIWEGQLP
jgi:hypothetical protein